MADQVLQAVHALYHHPDEGVKKQANDWLDAWQQSQEAWTISSTILRDPKSGLDAQYFCAQTLRTKVKIVLPLCHLLSWQHNVRMFQLAVCRQG